MRLQRFLAQAGLGSRRKCEEYITAGRITVDGKVADELGVQVEPDRQEVCLDGERIRREPKRYFLLNKPTGVVCTHRDPQGRPRAVDLVPNDGPRLFTVGRLDENSRGLLLVTNDGELAQRLAHPRYQVERVYRVQVAGRPNGETLSRLRRGLRFDGGLFRIRDIRRRKSQKNSTFLDVVLTEGRNREIRRLFARVGHKVLNLKRIGFGPLRLGNLKEGTYRPLKPAELKALRQLTEGSPRNKKPRGRRADVRGRKSDVRRRKLQRQGNRQTSDL